MIRKTFLTVGVLLALPGGLISGPARGQTLKFDGAIYVTCREAQAMTTDARRSLAEFLADHSARHRGVTIPPDERGGQLAMLVRGGCTLSPDSYLFGVIDRAILAERDKLPKR